MGNKRIEVRLAWIEAALRAGGKFPGRAYRKAFGISPQTESDDKNEFFARMQEMEIESTRKYGVLRADLPTERIFDPIDPRVWTADVSPSSVTEIEAPRLVSPEDATLSLVLRAVREGIVIRCDYTSMKSGTRRVTLSAHTFVTAVGRDHVRAFHHEKNSFRDYRLTRMANVVLDEREQFVDSQADEDWNSMVKVTLRPADNLMNKERLAVLIGLGAVESGEASFICRRALQNYMLQSLGLTPEEYTKQIEVSVAGCSEC